MTDSVNSQTSLATLILAIDPAAVDSAEWNEIRSRADDLIKNDIRLVPSIPSETTLEAMAAEYDSAFLAPPQESVIGLSDLDRRKIVARMRRVYRVALGDARSTGATEETEVDDQDGDWWRLLGASAHAELVSRLAGIEDRHWRSAREAAARYDPSVPFIVRNGQIGPMLVEWKLEGGQPGLYPSRPANDASDGSWHIRKDGLSRWLAVPFPRSARGWYELFLPEGRTQLTFDRLAGLRIALDELRKATIDPRMTEEMVGQVLGMFFEALKITVAEQAS